MEVHDSPEHRSFYTKRKMYKRFRKSMIHKSRYSELVSLKHTHTHIYI